MKNLDRLQEMFATYFDPEKIVYDLSRDKLMSSGLTFSFTAEIKNGQISFPEIPKTKFLLLDLLQERCRIISSFDIPAIGSKRINARQIFLLIDDVISITPESGGVFGKTIAKSVDGFRERQFLGKSLTEENYLHYQPKKLLQAIQQYQNLQLHVKMIPTQSGTGRAKFEKETFLHDSQAYVNHLLSHEHINRAWSRARHEALREEKLMLWGLAPTTEIPEKNPELFWKKIPFTDFGIDNILHLTWLSQNLFNGHYDVPTLKTMPASQLLYEHDLLKLRTALIFNWIL